jgi:hypothetical protein
MYQVRRAMRRTALPINGKHKKHPLRVAIDIFPLTGKKFSR